MATLVSVTCKASLLRQSCFPSSPSRTRPQAPDLVGPCSEDRPEGLEARTSAGLGRSLRPRVGPNSSHPDPSHKSHGVQAVASASRDGGPHRDGQDHPQFGSGPAQGFPPCTGLEDQDEEGSTGRARLAPRTATDPVGGRDQRAAGSRMPPGGPHRVNHGRRLRSSAGCTAFTRERWHDCGRAWRHSASSQETPQVSSVMAPF